MTTKSSDRKCQRCGHTYAEHSAGITGMCTHGVCECRWFKVDPRTGR
jgi:hypothetical protein